MPMDLLIYAGVAAVMVVWLMRVIGTRSSDDRQRPNPFAAGQMYDPAAAAEPAETRAQLAAPTGETADTPRSMESALVQIAIVDPDFSARRFSEQAKDAFLYVVGAFAKGDRETLKDLLSPAVYKHFENEILSREKAGERLHTEVQAIRKAEIIDASMAGMTANVTVRFEVSEVYALYATDGTVKAGDASRPVSLIDVWTFSRDTASRDPRWFVSATRPDTSAAAERAG